MKIVYIAGPYRGPNAWEIEANIRRAEVLGMKVAGIGAMPLMPHANTRYSHGLYDDEFWIEGTLELMRRCDAIMVVTHDRGTSLGTEGEIKEAHDLEMPVFFENQDGLRRLEDWLRGNPPDRRSECPVFKP